MSDRPEAQIHVIFSVPLAEGETVDEARRELTAWIDERLRQGTYEVITAAPYPLPVAAIIQRDARYRSLKALNDDLRQLASRTLNALDGLGLGHRGTLWGSWVALTQQDALDSAIDANLKRKLDRLGALAEVIGKALSAVEDFDRVKGDLDRVWDGIDREISAFRREEEESLKF